MNTRVKFSKQILSILLCLAMLMSYVPMTAFAADGDPVAKVGDTEYTTFADALNNWTDGTTLTLLADVTGLTERIKIYAKGLILDLNGYKIECSDTLCTIWIDGDSGSELTIRDSKGDGYIQGQVYAVHGGSTLRLESGTVEKVCANGDFTMTGGRIICEDDIALYVNDYVDVVISGGEISGTYGIYGSIAGSITVAGNAKITAMNGYAIYSGLINETIIDGTPTISGTKAEFSTEKGIVVNTLPADDTVWRVVIDTEYNKNGIFAVPGEGITLDTGNFSSAMDGYEVKQNTKGELLLCNHQTAYEAVSNEDGSTHKMLCCCGETTVEASVACSGFGATCQDKAVCDLCGQSYGETNPNAHTFNDDGRCVCGAERGEAVNIDLSTLTETYVISDSGEYIFTGSGGYGIKVERGNPKIVLNNVNISLTDGDYYDNNPINGIHIATAGGTTEILVMGENSITAEAGAGIFVAEGGTVKITGSSREDVLIATGASGCSGIGGYVYYTNGSVNCGNIEISNVTVKAFGSQSDMGDATPAIGGAGNGNCGYITIDNADVYAEGFVSPHGYEGSSAIGTGVDYINLEGGAIGEITIINDSNVYVTRGNYCDYIGCSGHEIAPADGVVNATAKSSTIYCYDSTDTTEPVQTLKYGALGGLLKEDGTCEVEHTFTGYICDNCGYCSCNHEGGTITYTLTEDGSQHTATWSCCGYAVTENHSTTTDGDKSATCAVPAFCSVCQQYYGEKLTHNYTYTADDETDTITESCDQGCGHNETITITVPSNAVYNGEEQGVTVNGDLIAEHTLAYNIEGTPVNAGTYTATLTVGGKSVSVEYTIAKATPTYEVPSGLTATYGDTLATVELPTGWTWRDEGATSVGNAGTRTFKALYNPDSTNYNTAEADVTIDVAKADVDAYNTLISPEFAEGLVYNGTAQALVTKTGYVEGGTIVYSLSPDGEYTATIPVATEAGTYVVYWGIKGDENHNDDITPGAVYTTVYITDATDPTGEILIKENSWKKFLNWISFGLFCKENVDVIVTADGTGSAVDKVEYLFSTTVLNENNLPTEGWTTVEGNNGTYTFAITAQNKGAVYVKITDAYGNVAVINSDGIVVYTDSNVTMDTVYFTYQSTEDVVVELELNGNTVKNVLFNGHEIAGYWSVEGNELTLDADYLGRLVVLKTGDSYPVTVHFNPLGVETDKVELKDEFGLVIQKAEGSVTNISDISKTYDGTPVSAPTFEQLGNGVATIEYKVKDADDSTYTTNAPTNAGDYVVRVTVAEGNNHKAASTTAEFNIERANIENAVVTLDKDTFVYNGTNQTPNVTVTFNGSTLKEGVDYDVIYQIPMQMTGGKPTKWFGDWTNSVDCINVRNNYYTVVKGMGNYYTKDLFTLYAPFVIEKATVIEPTIASKPYTGSVQTADIVDTDLYTVEQNNGGTAKGSYDVVLKLKDSANYKWNTTEAETVTLQFVISAAENTWITTPSINGWTYGEEVNAPAYAAKYGTVNVVYSGKANDGTDYNSETAPTKAGNYTVTFSVEVTEDYTGLSKSVDFTIAKKAITVTANDAGKIYGDSDPALTYTNTALVGQDTLDITVSRASGENANTYTITASQEEGANPNYEITFKTGTFTISKATLTVTAEDKTATYGDAVPNYTVKYEGFKNGDDKDDLGGTLGFECGYAQFSDKGEYTVKASGYTSGNYTISYVNGKLTVNAKPITVTIQNATSIYGDALAELKATDNGIVNDDANVYSLATTATSTSNVGKYAITGTALDGNYAITFVDGEYEITKREITITVDAKNTVVNTQLPTFTYKVEGLFGEDKFAVEPTLTCNADIAVIGEYEITASGADAGSNYTIKYVPAKLTVLTDNAVDAAAGYTEELKDYDPATVTSEDKAELEEILNEINTILADETTTDNGKKALEEVKEQVENLIKEITDAAGATDTENIGKVENVTPENVTPENKTDLENAKADLEKALEDNGGNYTDDETKAIEDEIKRIDDALDVIENVEAVEELIDKIPENITKNDEDAIKAADDAYNALTDYEKSLVDEDAKKALDDAKAALAELNKPADTDSPQTGDDSNLWLWFALLFVSGAGVFGITVYDRKRKMTSKR